MDRASLEEFLARGLSLAAIGRRVGRHEATVAYWVEKHGLRPANRARHLARGGLLKEDLEAFVQSGASIAEIAVAVGRSKGTVRHWLTRFGLKTVNRPGRRPSAEEVAAKKAGLASKAMVCPLHGKTSFWLDGRGSYRCKRCRSAAVTKRRRRVKAILVAEAGGACCVCGYASNMRALHFHHLDPGDKRLEINAKGVALSLERLRAEAQKCVLLCSNCHAEVEDGAASIPVDAVERRCPAQHFDDPG
jgi:transposase